VTAPLAGTRSIERFKARGMGRILLGRRAERDQRSVDIEKRQRRLRRAGHGARERQTTTGTGPEPGQAWAAMDDSDPIEVCRSSVRGKQAHDQVSLSSRTPNRGYVACAAGRRASVMPRPHGVPHESGHAMAIPCIRTAARLALCAVIATAWPLVPLSAEANASHELVVPNYPTIQAAVDAAQPGDRIRDIRGAGTYLRALRLHRQGDLPAVEPRSAGSREVGRCLVACKVSDGLSGYSRAWRDRGSVSFKLRRL
jgi:hypothetical protein